MPSNRQYFLSSVEGAEEIAAVLDAIPPSLDKSVLVAISELAAQPIIDAAKMLCPVDISRFGGMAVQVKGSLKDSIGLRRWRGRKYAGVIVGPKWPEGAHGFLVEFGTGPRYHKDGKYVGIMPAEPFMRPAWDANKENALEIMRTKIWGVIVKTVRRLRGRAEHGTISRTQSQFFGGF